MAYHNSANCTVWVGGLSRTTQESDLHRVFSSCGDVTKCTIKRFAFVEFADEEGAERALEELDNVEIHGATIMVRSKTTDVPGRFTGTDQTESNSGRTKVCFNYLKGKCRYGGRCKFRHDSPEARNPKHHHSRVFGGHEMSQKSLKLSDIKQPLSMRTHAEKFHKLLFWEEIEHEKILKERCNGNYILVILAPDDRQRGVYAELQHQHMRYGYLIGITANQVEYASQASNGMTLTIERGTKLIQKVTGECIQYQQSVTIQADILWRNYSQDEDQLNLAFDASVLVNLEIGQHESCKLPVRVEFELKHFYFETLHQSLEKLPPSLLRRIFPDKSLFPKPTCTITGPLLTGSYVLSDDQELALRAMLSVPSHGPPFLLSGPFGTGKTLLLAAAAHCFFNQGRESRTSIRIFVGTQQHVAAKKFLECFNKMLPHDDVYIAQVVPDKYPMKSSDMEEFIWIASDFRSNLASFKRQHLCLVIATCMTSMQLGRLLPGSFTHLLLDEGANIREPEGIIPLQLADPNTKIVIAGDHHQVGPSLVVLGEEAHANGLSKSLYERLLEHYTSLGNSAKGYHMMLVTNFRCHAGILRLVEQLFYGTQLRRGVPDGSAHPDALFPLKFICSSVDNTVRHIRSMTNEREAMIVLQEAKKFCMTWPEESDFSQICAISRTRSQISIFFKLLSRLSTFDKRMKGIEKLPTFNIQGHEFDAVFISTSEPTVMLDGGLVSPSDPTKSISDRFVFNTVITRSRSLVVAVGNPFLLLKIERFMVRRYGKMGKCWSHYLDACIKNGSLSIQDPDITDPQESLEKIKDYVLRSLAVQC